MTDESKQKSESEWRAILPPEQFRVLRQKGTERPGTGEYEHHMEQGVYSCAGCGTQLYKSSTKFLAGCGWPAFLDAIAGAVNRHEVKSLFTTRIEIACAACGGHLGHIFDGHHCVNSASIKFHGE